MRTSLLIALASAISSGCHSPASRPRVGEPSERVAQIAAAHANRFHEAVDRADYGMVCNAADAAAFGSVTGLSCTEFLTYMRTKLGRFQGILRAQLPTVEDNPAGRAVRVGLQYTTQYEHGAASERFTWRIEGDRATLAIYSISADALSR